MIDESLFKVNHLGKDGFIWWLGKVAPRDSWKDGSLITNYDNPEKKAKTWDQRCKVRIIGYHSFRKSELEDKDLPWAHIMIDPMFGSGQGGEGMTHNIRGGETCFGFFLDGDDAQQPVVVGLLNRHPFTQNFPEDREFAFTQTTGMRGTIPSTKRPISPPAQPKSAPQAPTPQGLSSVIYNNGGYVEFQTQPEGQLVDGNLIGFSSSFNLDLNSIGIGTSLFQTNYGDKLWAADNNAAILAAYKLGTVTITPPSDCHNNLIGQITQALQDFISFTNGLQKYAGVYIDPVLNEVVNIGSSIKSAAQSIGGIIRIIINSLRSSIIKCLMWAFKKLIGFISPEPQQTIAAQATKNIKNILFCLFEKLIPIIIDFIERFLTDMVDTVFTAPICAIEQWTAGILTNVMNIVEDSVDTILSGVSELTGALSNVFEVLNNASSLAAQIYNFIGCDGLKCTKPSKWVSTFGPSEIEEDNWPRMVSNINVFKGISDGLGSVESAMSELSFYSQSPIYADCNNRINNPTSQDDLPLALPGTRLSRCIPPKIGIYGDGFGARLFPVISPSGSLLAVEILSSGVSYTTPPALSVIDNSNYGRGARIKAEIDENGSINKIIILNPGTGYCPGTKDNLEDGIGDEAEDDEEFKCPEDGGEEQEPITDTKFNLTLTSDKSKIYEGEKVKIKVVSTNQRRPRKVRYEIVGVIDTDISIPLRGELVLENGEAEIEIETFSNNIIDNKFLVFSIPKYKKLTSILIEDEIRQTSNREYNLVSDKDSINEGTPFTIELITQNVPDDTVVPFTIKGISVGLIQNQDEYSNFVISNNKSRIRFNTNKGVIKNNEVFTLELRNKKDTVSVLINSLSNNNGITTTPTACITELTVVRPGIGYNIQDTATDGVNTYDLIISPENGAIFGVKPLKQKICGFPDVPNISINTNTGIGAEILPVLELNPNPSSGIDNISQDTTTSIKIVDCI